MKYNFLRIFLVSVLLLPTIILADNMTVTEMNVTNNDSNETNTTNETIVETNNTIIDNSTVEETVKYQIIYVLNGGVNNENNPTNYDGKTTIYLENPSKEGYTFLGWYKDKKLKKKLNNIKEGSTGDKTFYAKWKVNTYTIKFNSNGGKGKTKSQSKIKYNKTVKLNKNNFKKSGYKFIGWNTKQDGSGTHYSNKSKVKNITSSGSITLYAQWEKITYNITYKLNGGVNNENNPSNYDVTSETITLNNPTKEHYQFLGWYKDKKYKKKITNIKTGSTGNKTLYAKWKVDTYTIKFDSNGGKGKTSSVKCKYNSNCKLTSNKFYIYGQKFVGWNTAPDGTGTSYKNNEKVKNLSNENGAVITLYAQWNDQVFKITYVLNGGINNENNPTTFKSNDLVWFESPTREGYIFEGWYMDKNCKGQVYYGMTQFKKNVTVYAKWKEDDTPKSYEEYKERATKLVEENWSTLEETTNYVNELRKEAGVEPLVLDKDLSIYATVKSMEMSYTNSFEHSGPNGEAWGYLNEKLGIYSSGENILQNATTPQQAVSLWSKSSGHYANMVRESFTKIGVGVYNYYWTQEFNY